MESSNRDLMPSITATYQGNSPEVHGVSDRLSCTDAALSTRKRVFWRCCLNSIYEHPILYKLIIITTSLDYETGLLSSIQLEYLNGFILRMIVRLLRHHHLRAKKTRNTESQCFLCFRVSRFCLNCTHFFKSDFSRGFRIPGRLFSYL